MKKTRKLIPALVMLLVSAVMMSTASFAWFSINDKVDVDGMAVQATATGSLVITSGTTVNTGATSLTTGFGLTASTATVLKPMSWVATGKLGDGNDTAVTPGYHFVANPTDVDPATGFAPSGKELKYTAVTDGTGYYVDYIVYLAASGDKIDDSTLTANVTFGGNSKGQRAVTVDFLVGTTVVTAATTTDAVGTMNHEKFARADGTSTVALGTVDIPLNTEGYIPVVMRVYIDGAAGASGEAYINNDDGSVAGVTVEVEFAIS